MAFATFWDIVPVDISAWMQEVAEKANGYKMRNGRVVEVVFRG